MRSLRKAVAACATAVLLSGAAAKGAALVNLQILGSTDGGSTYSSSLTVNPGQTIAFEVVGQIAPLGTSNTRSPATTITSLVPGTDGINSLAFNLNDSDSGTFNTGLALGSGWNGGSGFGVGSVNGNTLTDVRPIQAPGVFVGATASSIILTGTFTAGTLASPETLGGSWATTGTTSGSFKVNGGASSKIVSTTTEGSTDPFIGFSALTLTTGEASPVPSPAVVPASILLAGMFGLLRLKRRQQLA